MTPDIDVDAVVRDATTRLEARVAERVEAIRTHVTDCQNAEAAQAAAAEAERAKASSWAAAVRLGCDEELRDLGFTEPARKAPGRPPRATRKRAPNTRTPPDDADHTSAGNGSTGDAPPAVETPTPSEWSRYAESEQRP